ncbi:sex hormone-binding globulin [Denticeps clupeoides]|uniref:sex hormone-binding globulin n=1 Tax=Denticeps clupeoides TaxID=299321 RepID=UPI0010A48D79|nr:sex hormone-binding globulin [Denticeps clupeoides]
MELTNAGLGVLLLAFFTAWEGTGSQSLKVKRTFPSTGIINLGNRDNKWTPLMNISTKLSEITRITSHFEFRTFDPEGAIFYGDTRDGQDWFVLSLRGGIPEMQIGKADILVSVTGGPKLNDGLWHKMELRSEGMLVVLEVDNKKELVVGLHSKEAQANMTGYIRLALGGILVDEKKLVFQFGPLMDGCLRQGHWLNLSSPWDTTLEVMPTACFPKIKKGSFFPGTGLAAFNTSDLPGPSLEDTISISVNMSSDDWSGTLMYMQVLPSRSATLRVTGQSKAKKLSVTLSTESGAENYDIEIDSPNFHLAILRNTMTFKLHNEEIKLQDNNQDFLARWKEGMLLAFGGVPGDSVENKGSDYLEGCVDSIHIQGNEVDLDEALFKDPSVFSHSCPVS